MAKFRKARLAPVLIMSMVAAGCVATGGQGFTPPTPAQTYQMACDSTSVSISILAGFRAAGKLKPTTINQINLWIPTADRLCDENTRDVTTGLDAIKAIANDMLDIRTTLKPEGDTNG